LHYNRLIAEGLVHGWTWSLTITVLKIEPRWSASNWVDDNWSSCGAIDCFAPALQQGHFLLEDPERLAYELALKEEAFSTKKDVVLAAEERSLPAQQVLLVCCILHALEIMHLHTWSVC
jgi:hypothetical protein